MGRKVPNAMVVRALDLASPDPQRPQTRWLARGVPLATGGQHGRQMPVLSTEGSQRGGEGYAGGAREGLFAAACGPPTPATT